MGIQNKLFQFLSPTEGTDVVVNLIADDVWGSENELTGAVCDEVEDWYCLYL